MSNNLLARWCLFGALVPFACAAEQTNETSILFIGNSFTFVNNLPGILTTMAKAGGQKTLVTAQETPGGCTLEAHWKNGKALKAINSRAWDFVVLQEQSTRPVDRKDFMFEYARKFNEAITNQGAQTLLYMTWAWPTPETQPVITAAYQDLAVELKAQLVPVGIAWSAMVQKHPEICLFGKDNKHPSPAGSYLAACVFYARMYRCSPEGLPTINGLKETEAQMIQHMAASTVQEKSGKRKDPQ